MPYTCTCKSHGSDQLTNEILQCTCVHCVCSASLCSLVEDVMDDDCNIQCILCFLPSLSSLVKDVLNEFCVLNSRQPFTYQESRIPLTKSDCPLLPTDCIWKAQAFAALHLLQLTSPRMFILALGTEMCYFIMWLSFLRESCVARFT